MPTVLFVDDDPAILVTFPRMLRREPYEIVVAESAAKALAILDSRPVQVVVTDQQMPGMRGTELLERVHERYPLTVRMILTGEPGSSTVIEVGRTVQHVLRKPASADEIKRAIASALESPSAS